MKNSIKNDKNNKKDKNNKYIKDTAMPLTPNLSRKPLDRYLVQNKKGIVTNNKSLEKKTKSDNIVNNLNNVDEEEKPIFRQNPLDESDSFQESYSVEESFEEIHTEVVLVTTDENITTRKSCSVENTENSTHPKDIINKDRVQESVPRQLAKETVLYCNRYYFALALLIAILAYWQWPSNNKKTNCSFFNLKKAFPNQNDNLWEEMTIGIQGILNNDPATPGVYLFLHENNYSTKHLIETIVKTSSNCFDPNLQPIRLVTEDFISNDYGTIIEKYKENIKDGGVVIVANLNEIPPESAKALHTICDSYNPIVERVIIFLTLTVPPDEKGQPLEIAENKLNYLWATTIQQNELEPLISRLTESVLRLQ